MCRTMVESLISEKGGKKSLRHDLESRHIAELDEFHKKSFFFQYLLSFTSKSRLRVHFIPFSKTKRKGKTKVKGKTKGKGKTKVKGKRK